MALLSCACCLRGIEAPVDADPGRFQAMLSLVAPDQCHIGSSMPMRLTLVNMCKEPYSVEAPYPELLEELTFAPADDGAQAQVLEYHAGTDVAWSTITIPPGLQQSFTIYLASHVIFGAPGRTRIGWSAIVHLPGAGGSMLPYRVSGVLEPMIRASDDAVIKRELDGAVELVMHARDPAREAVGVEEICSIRPVLAIPCLGRLIASGRVQGVQALAHFRHHPRSRIVLTSALINREFPIFEAALQEFAARGELLGADLLLPLLRAGDVRKVAAILDYLAAVLAPGNRDQVQAFIQQADIARLCDGPEIRLSNDARLLIHALDPTVPLRLRTEAGPEEKALITHDPSAIGF